MRKVAVLLVYVLLLGVITPTIAESIDTPRSEKTPLVSDKTFVQSELGDKEGKIKSLVEKAKKNGNVRIIIEFDVDFKPEGDLKSKNDVKEQRDKIKNLQNSILQSLKKGDYDLVHKFKYTPLITLNVNEKALKHIESNPLIRSIHEDKLGKPTLTASIPLIGVDDSHFVGLTGLGQTVAILDTGIDSTHPWFSSKIVSEACYSTTFLQFSATTVCPNGQAEQIGAGSAASVSSVINGYDHGTHVAGIAAGNDGAGNTGVAKEATIISIQVFSRIDDASLCDPDPSPCLSAFTTDVIKGLDRIFELSDSFNIAAVNLSLGFDLFTTICDSEILKPSIDQLRSVGIATIASSGNDFSVNAIRSPSCISSVVSVGSTTVNSHNSGLLDDGVSNFSNTVTFLDLLAPGHFILSSVPGGLTSVFAGTSQAAPQVTGAWAVLKERSPNMSVDNILSALKNSGILITDTRPSTVGLPNIIKPRIQLNAAISDIIIPEGSGNPGCESTSTCFIPFQLTTNEGKSVIWYNEDSVDHTITSGNPTDGPDGIFISGLISARDSFSHVFPRAGTFDYFDPIHPWQQGQIIVNTVPCSPPVSGDWVITGNCTLLSSSTSIGNVIIQNGSVLTIPAGLSLDIDFVNNFLKIKSGSGVLIRAGGSIT